MSYHYCGAGVDPGKHDYKIFTKYGVNPEKIVQERINETDRKNRVIKATCPDRTLWITKDGSFVPEGFDEFTPINPFTRNSTFANNIPWVLFSAHHYKSTWRREEWFTNEKLKLIVDSGGAQLRFGTAEYVNPFKIVKNMNDIKGTHSVVLDIPPTQNDLNPINLKLLAETQRNNIEIFKKNGDQNLSFLNVFHGGGVWFDEWIDIVDDSFLDGWAVGFGSLNDHQNWFNLSRLIKEKRQTKSNHFHILGRGNKGLFPVMAWIGKDVSLSSDSSYHIFTAIKGRIFENLQPDSTFKKIRFGQKTTSSTKGRGGNESQKEKYTVLTYTPEVEIPCSCTMCAMVKYGEIYAITELYPLMALHNLHSMNNWNKWWNHQAEAYRNDFEGYCKLLTKYLKPGMAEYSISVLRFINFCFDNKPKAVRSQFSDELKNDFKPNVKGVMKTLFDRSDKKMKSQVSNLNIRKNSMYCLSYYHDFRDLGKYLTKDEYIKAKIKMIRSKNPKMKLKDDEIFKKVSLKKFVLWKDKE